MLVIVMVGGERREIDRTKLLVKIGVGEQRKNALPLESEIQARIREQVKTRPVMRPHPVGVHRRSPRNQRPRIGPKSIVELICNVDTRFTNPAG